MLRVLIVVLLTQFSLAQDSTEMLSKADWPKVVQAARSLEGRQEHAIPNLLKLMDREEKVKLVHTADLIYPGADKFYGHGLMIDYDLDWLPARAGWVLETITFQDFGFRQARTQAQRQAAAQKARAWWVKQKGWKRGPALVEALRSKSVVRQEQALGYLRYPTGPCRGVDPRYYQDVILPAVRQLSSAQAKSLLNEPEPWMKIPDE